MPSTLESLFIALTSPQNSRFINMCLFDNFTKTYKRHFKCDVAKQYEFPAQNCFFSYDRILLTSITTHLLAKNHWCYP